MLIARAIYKALEELVECCERYKECDKCNKTDCPMGIWCIDEETLANVAYEVSYDTIKEFVTGADELTDYVTLAEWESEQGNLERCDPPWE